MSDIVIPHTLTLRCDAGRVRASLRWWLEKRKVIYSPVSGGVVVPVQVLKTMLGKDKLPSWVRVTL